MLFENKYLHFETLSNLELIFGSETFHLNVKKFSRSTKRIQIFERANEKQDPIQTSSLSKQQQTFREKTVLKNVRYISSFEPPSHHIFFFYAHQFIFDN